MYTSVGLGAHVALNMRAYYMLKLPLKCAPAVSYISLCLHQNNILHVLVTEVAPSMVKVNPHSWAIGRKMKTSMEMFISSRHAIHIVMLLML